VICWFQTIGYTGCEYRADGQPDRAHLIPAQRLRREGLAHLAWDRRCWVPSCRRHHHLYDTKTLRLTREQYPPELRAFAEAIGFEFVDPRTGWVATRPREAA
jgi:hypothetical protein